MFTLEEENILKGVVNKLKIKDELDKLEKQRKGLALEMNNKIKIEQDKTSVLVTGLHTTYDPQIVTLDTQIDTKKDELDAIL